MPRAVVAITPRCRRIGGSVVVRRAPVVAREVRPRELPPREAVPRDAVPRDELP
jgi:hypothetical protein